MTTSFVHQQVEIVEYADLLQIDRHLQFPASAFGVNGLGVIAVRGIPEYVERRRRLLPLAWQFAQLDGATQAKYEDPKSYFQFGWSCGREKLQGRPDYSKGSYYNNPLHDCITEDPAIISAYPAFASPNIWPTEEMPELEMAFKALGQLVVEVGVLVARHCDHYVNSQVPAYADDTLQRVVRDSKCCKARLLHYYSHSHQRGSKEMTATVAADDGDSAFSSWCGWHNDHGALTGLCPALLLNEDSGQVAGKDCIDPEAGLYVRNRQSALIKVMIPDDCLAFQIGETAQILSGGFLQATPHAVRAASSSTSRISRETFAVFMEPEYSYPMRQPTGIDPFDAQSQEAAANLPKGVPPIAARWNPLQSFGEFTEATLAAYH